MGQGPSVGLSSVGHKALPLRDKFCICETPLGSSCRTGETVSLSLPPVCRCPFTFCHGRACSGSFQVFFRGKFSICSCRFVLSVAEVNSGSYFANILNCLPVCSCLYLRGRNQGSGNNFHKVVSFCFFFFYINVGQCLTTHIYGLRKDPFIVITKLQKSGRLGGSVG